ncbi:MAG TPA: YheC/YheD family protein [Syntrophomonadaceae bacterium]|nr:YheC/YheD family protein [Syntrophomonadaceae bacterium]HQE24211.1 YheC/YheD family protein [Syntrophomonadaceae bacterium]
MGKDYPELHLPSDQAALLGLESNNICRLALGNKSIEVLVDVVEEDSDPLITISPELSIALGIPEGLEMNIRQDGDKLRIGPLAGILTDAYNQQKGSFGTQESFFRGLLYSMRYLHGLAYVFTPQDINWQKNRIHGYYLLPGQRHWKRTWFPFPDVCYNRFFKHRYIVLPDTTVSRARLQSRVKTFNTHIGSKLKVHKQLAQDASIAPHLPETRLFSSIDQFRSMLSRYKAVYIKPINGSQGAGIIKVSKRNKNFVVKTNDRQGEGLYTSLTDAWKAVRAASSGRQLIIQQAIRVSGAPHFDFRLLIQKDRRNTWSVTGIAARIGSRTKITTNLHTGGQAVSLGHILANRGFSSQQISSIQEEMETLALQIAQCINKSMPLIGELGLDFIVDHRGKVWFLEANPKPARASFGQIDENLRNLTILKPMEYACYLAGF